MDRSRRRVRGLAVVLAVIGIMAVSGGTGSALDLDADLNKKIALAQKDKRAGNFSGAIETLESVIALISKDPGDIDVHELTFFTVPPKLLAGAKLLSLHIQIDKLTS